MQWIFLSFAIVAEVIATTALRAADGFTRVTPALIVVAGYATSFYFLSLTLRTIPMGVTYAIWSGVGIVLISIAGFVIYNQRLDAAALTGIGLILAGVLVMQLFSKTLSL
ncbi:MAG: multidrug efflux SMR transporter [Burkholderiales bacterium]